jgi:CHAD domain-containing protein
VSAGLLSSPPEEGARRLALSYLDQAAAARPRLDDPTDTEALHDFRVGLRRLRSCLRAYRPYLADSVPKKLARRLRRLAASTNPGRDTEVQIEWLRGRASHLSSYNRAGLTWLLARLEERMRAAQAEMEAELADEFAEIEEGLRRRLSVYRTEVRLDGSKTRPTLADATAEIVREQVAELESHLSLVEDVEDQEEAHEARISAKRLRYLIEPLAEEIPGAGPVVKRFKALQDLLGELHDAHVLELELAAAIEVAAAERARKLLTLSIEDTPDEQLLRAERRRARESGLISLARLNRARRNRLFDTLKTDWLAGAMNGFLREVEALMDPHPPAPSPEPSQTPSPGEGENVKKRKR